MLVEPDERRKDRGAYGDWFHGTKPVQPETCLECVPRVLLSTPRFHVTILSSGEILSGLWEYRCNYLRGAAVLYSSLMFRALKLLRRSSREEVRS